MKILSIWACRFLIGLSVVGLPRPPFASSFSLLWYPRTDSFTSDGRVIAQSSKRIRKPTLLSTSKYSSADTTSRGSSLSPSTFANITLDFRLHSSISEIPKEEWNECLRRSNETETSSAFLDHSWLQCLEESGCAAPKTGWMAQHLSIQRRNDDDDNDNAKEWKATTIGFVPLYIKGHSLGEFIFDNAWAEAAYQNGINYYPKMLVAVPFTPATGNRILFHPSIYNTLNNEEIAKLRKAVAKFLRKVVLANKLSSVHINFMTESEATDICGELSDGPEKKNQTMQEKVQEMLLGRRRLVGNNFLRRTSVQYHWSNRNPDNNGLPYTSFDDYLSCFKSKRRINIRRERRKVREDEGIRVDAIRGREILRYPGLMERMFEIYRSTIDKMYFGRQYLSLEFFQILAKSDFVDYLCFMCARYNKNNSTTTSDEFCVDDVFAGTFNVIRDGVFYGRYWGCLAEQEIKNLHFETCYWSAIEYCIQEGLDRMEPGAGGGDYKWARGFDPAVIHSAHYICHPGLRSAIAEYVDYETENNLQAADYLQWRRRSGGTSHDRKQQ